VRDLKKWTIALLVGLVVATLGLLLALWAGALYMELAFKLGGG